MISVEKLYGELWGDEGGLEVELAASLGPRRSDSFYDAFAALAPQPGDLVVDVGCRDARHAIELVRRHSVRVVAIDPVARHVELAHERVIAAGLGGQIEVVQAGIESMPLARGEAAFVWCRDVTTHVDLAAGLSECARVLPPGGRMLVYQTFATDLLEAKEAARLYEATAGVAENMDPRFFDRTATEAGLEIERVDPVESEWREAMLEEGSWDAAGDLLALARLRRREPDLVARFGRPRVEATRGDKLWGIYQMLGKLCPTVYVLRRAAS